MHVAAKLPWFFAVIAAAATVAIEPLERQATTLPPVINQNFLDLLFQRLRSDCSNGNVFACFQYKAFKFLDVNFWRDHFQVGINGTIGINGNTGINGNNGNNRNFGNNVILTRNNYQIDEESARSDPTWENGLELFIKTHDVTFKIPYVGDVMVDSTALDNEQLGIKLNFGSDEVNEERSRKKSKSKIKKILSPILIFLLLKAITLVPFAIGILGLKAWNGLQLAFISFIISTGLAIFQLCQKLAENNAHAHAHIASSPLETHWARNFDGAQNLAYSAYAN